LLRRGFHCEFLAGKPSSDELSIEEALRLYGDLTKS